MKNTRRCRPNCWSC